MLEHHLTPERTTISMDVQLESNPPTPYVSAPTSPSGLSFIDIHSFYGNGPASPTRGLTTSPFAWESKHGSTRGTKTDSDSDEFEFGTSGNFNSCQCKHQHKQRKKVEQSSPAMFFADEPFCNGRVLPLKLPPRLQHQSRTNCSFRPPSSVLRGPFPGRRFKNKEDSDPFMAALEKVRKEDTKSAQWTTRWSSMFVSMLWSPRGDAPSTGRVQDQHQDGEAGHLEPTMGTVELDPRGPMKPTRSASERVVGDMRLDLDNQLNSNITPVSESAADMGGTSTNVPRRWSSFPRVPKRRMIRFFSPRSASQGREYPKDKLRDRTASLKITRAARKAIVPQTQRLFDCLGFSSKAMKYMN